MFEESTHFSFEFDSGQNNFLSPILMGHSIINRDWSTVLYVEFTLAELSPHIKIIVYFIIPSEPLFFFKITFSRRTLRVFVLALLLDRRRRIAFSEAFD